MKVIIDSNRYFTGNYSLVGGIEAEDGFTSETVEGLPSQDFLKQKAYKLSSDKTQWIFDENKYNELLEAKEEESKIPSEIEKIRGDIDYLAMEMGVEI